GRRVAMRRVTSYFTRSVGAKILGLVLGAVLLMGSGGALFVVQAQQNAEAQILRSQTALATDYARRIDEFLGGIKALTETAARHRDLRAPLRPETIDADAHGVPPDVDPERRAALQDLMAGSGRYGGASQILPDGQRYMLEPFATQQVAPPNEA